MNFLLNETIDPADKNRIMSHLKAARANLPFLLKLSKKDRMGGLNMGDDRYAAARKALKYANEYPDLWPRHYALAHLENDLDLYNDLKDVEVIIIPFSEMVADTKKQAGKEAYKVFLSFYRNAKGAASDGIPGADAIVKDLGRIFEDMGTTPEKELELLAQDDALQAEDKPSGAGDEA